MLSQFVSTLTKISTAQRGVDRAGQHNQHRRWFTTSLIPDAVCDAAGGREMLHRFVGRLSDQRVRAGKKNRMQGDGQYPCPAPD